jgi:hypothetical protein
MSDDFRDPNKVPKKQIQAEISSSMEELWNYAFKKTSGRRILHTVTYSARIYCLLSRQADIQTRRVIWLTWALVALTVVLLFYTWQLRSIALHTDKQLEEIAEIARAQKAAQPNPANKANKE